MPVYGAVRSGGREEDQEGEESQAHSQLGQKDTAEGCS